MRSHEGRHQVVPARSKVSLEAEAVSTDAEFAQWARAQVDKGVVLIPSHRLRLQRWEAAKKSEAEEAAERKMANQKNDETKLDAVASNETKRAAAVAAKEALHTHARAPLHAHICTCT